jgi:hypothetical protein
VSDPVRVPPPLEALIRAVAGGAGEEDREQRASTFARGLALGALVGAAIAGSTIWQRRLAKGRESHETPARRPSPRGDSEPA